MTDQPLALEDETTYCEVHPDRETGLRCNKCGRYMCSECAVQTPIGYRCKQCVRQLEDKFYNDTSMDPYLIFGTSAGLTAVGAVVVSFIGWFIIAIFAGIFAGGAVSEAVRRVVQKRRGRRFPEIAAAGAVIGALVGVWVAFSLRVGVLIPPTLILQLMTRNIALLIFTGIVAFIVYTRLKI